MAFLCKGNLNFEFLIPRKVDIFIPKTFSTMAMTTFSEAEALKKRDKIQLRFWNQVGAIEHINLPKLEDAIKKEFKCSDKRFIQAQINLMQTESRIRVQNRVKVWVKQPNSQLES